MAVQNLTTVWNNVGNYPLQEYPRPQFVRDSYINLNGWWNYAISTDDVPRARFDGQILVPFSPEAQLSQVMRTVTPKDFLHYQTRFTITKAFFKGVVLLHFGAVDSIADVYINEKHAGRHVGGYNSFQFDITDFVNIGGENVLYVIVRDFSDTSFYTNGKQSTHRKGMWYTAQSGIWQTVWLESVAPQYIKGCKLTPIFDEGKLCIKLDKQDTEEVTAIVFDGETEIAKTDSAADEFEITLPQNFKIWTPEEPFLYGLQLISRRDMVKSYFGMRKFSIKRDEKGILRTMLNNKPYFHNGLLDQGYWPDGLYTAPCDEAMVFDITLAKSMGFNMLRKHIKVEPLRWYYHCDRLGMLVWQDMPSGGSSQHKMYTLYLPFLGVTKVSDKNRRKFSRDASSAVMYEKEYTEMLNNLYNCVSIAAWVPFNEGWGQFDANKRALLTKKFDPSRHVDHASGWHDQGGGDFKSAHVYFRKVRLPKDKHRAVVLSEFGGYCLKVKQHCFNPDYAYGYKHFDNEKSLQDALVLLYKRDVEMQIKNGLTAAVYTQISDVEDEVNGLVTYDRKVVKVDRETMEKINQNVRLNIDNR